jgi:hypothetical protein
VVSIGLLSTFALSRDRVEALAQPELDRLLNIRNNHGWDSASSVIHDALEQADQNANTFKPTKLQLRIPNNPYLSAVVSLWLPGATYATHKSALDKRNLRELQTLEEMRDAWNAVTSVKEIWIVDTEQRPVIQLETEFGITIPLASEPLLWEPHPSNQRVPDVTAVESPIGDPQPIFFAGVVLTYDFSPVIKSIGPDRLAPALRIPSNLLNGVKLRLLLSARRKDLFAATFLDDALGKKRDFAEAFPNLDRLSDNYQKQRLNSLKASLETATQQSKGDLEILGAKIPSDLITRFGLPVLATLLFQFSAICFYAASHIERLEEEDASQWSFLLTGWPFWLLSFGAVFALPVVAGALSSWKLFSAQGKPWYENWIDAVFFIIALACAATAFFGLRTLRSRVLPNPGVQRKAAASPAELTRRILFRFKKAITHLVHLQPVAAQKMKFSGPDIPNQLPAEQPPEPPRPSPSPLPGHPPPGPVPEPPLPTPPVPSPGPLPPSTTPPM